MCEKKIQTVAWMGGSRPRKPSQINRTEWGKVKELFREQVSLYQGYWSEFPDKEYKRLFFNRARYDAHASCRDLLEFYR